MTHKDTADLTIGELALAAAVNVETIRYYQPCGLIAEPRKPLGGHRRYPQDAVKRLRFIKRAQNLAFTLNEVRGLLTLEDGQSCRDTRLLAENELSPRRHGRLPDSHSAIKPVSSFRMQARSASRFSITASLRLTPEKEVSKKS